MKCSCGKNKIIESVNGIVRAFKNRFPEKKYTIEEVTLYSSEILGRLLEQNNEETSYYGILSVGNNTELDIILPEGKTYHIESNNQIIELIKGVSKVGGSDGTNLFFRGYEITFSN